MSANIFVWVEQDNGQPVSASWEALGLARQLAGGNADGHRYGAGVWAECGIRSCNPLSSTARTR